MRKEKKERCVILWQGREPYRLVRRERSFVPERSTATGREAFCSARGARPAAHAAAEEGKRPQSGAVCAEERADRLRYAETAAFLLARARAEEEAWRRAEEESQRRAEDRRARRRAEEESQRRAEDRRARRRAEEEAQRRAEDRRARRRAFLRQSAVRVYRQAAEADGHTAEADGYAALEEGFLRLSRLAGLNVAERALQD